jgi:hypothetical protein
MLVALWLRTTDRMYTPFIQHHLHIADSCPYQHVVVFSAEQRLGILVCRGKGVRGKRELRVGDTIFGWQSRHLDWENKQFWRSWDLPYTGPAWLRDVGFVAGHSIDKDTSHNVWFVCAPHAAYALVLSVPLQTLIFRTLRNRRRRSRGMCTACGYDLRATRDRCPECGRPIPLARDDKRIASS